MNEELAQYNPTCPLCGRPLTHCEDADCDEETQVKAIYACNFSKCKADFVYIYSFKTNKQKGESNG